MKQKSTQQSSVCVIVYAFALLIALLLFLELLLTPIFKESVAGAKFNASVVLIVLLLTCFLSFAIDRFRAKQKEDAPKVLEVSVVKFLLALSSVVFFGVFFGDSNPSGIVFLGILAGMSIISLILLTAFPRVYKQVISFLDRNKIARLLQFIAIQCFVIFLLIEVVFRILGPAMPEIKSGFVADEKLGYRHRPGAMHRGRKLNSGGFFDEEFTTNKLPNEHRIVALGDSFAAGWVPYEDNFLTVLENDLQKNSSMVETTVLNMGVPGYGLIDEMRLLNEEGLALKPDAIILAFYVGNDFTDNVKGERRTVRGGQIVTIPPWRPVGKFMANESWTICNYIKAIRVVKSQRADQEARKLSGGKKTPADNGTFSKKVYNKYLRRKRGIYLRKRSRYLKERVAFAKELLLELKEDLQKREIPWLLVLIPDEVQVDESVRAELFRAYDLERDEYDFDRPQREMVEFCTEEGIEVLDLLAPFRRDTTQERLYLLRDSHWNKAGNALAAREISDYITKHWQEPRSSITSNP